MSKKHHDKDRKSKQESTGTEKVEKAKVPDYIKAIATSMEKEGKTLDMRPVTLSFGRGGINWALSSGSLSLDLILGGGYGPGRSCSTFGPEQSGKTTGAYEAIGDALLNGIPVILYDAENATDPDYLDRIIFKRTGHPMEYFVGVIEDDKIIKPGLFYYIPCNSGENVFRHAGRIIKNAVPKVVKSKKHGWCWANKNKNGTYSFTKREIGGRTSMLVVIDSLKALLPEAKEKDDKSSPLAQQARMLSDSFPLVINPMGPRRVTVLYTNQVRTKIGQMFGNPEYEPCGDAAKFYSSQRVRFGSISCSTVDPVFTTSGVTDEGKGQVDEEPSWDNDGTDRYRYAKLKCIKNKLFSPFQESYVRWRFEHHSNVGDGLDPSFDAYMFLYKTGQCSKKTGKGIELSILGTDQDKYISPNFIDRMGDLATKKKEKKKKHKDKKEKKLISFDLRVSWQKFKELVENPERKNCIYDHCRKQMDSGYAWALYFAKKKAVMTNRKENDQKNEDKKKEDDKEGGYED